jgi:Ca-activated chloride channel family protein
MDKFYSVLLAVLCVLTPLSVWAQDDDDDSGMLEEVTVSGIRATQGGAQDIDFFRGEVEQARIPHPETITAEGLFSQHDILFNADKPCQQLFCLTSEYMPVELIAQPEAKFLVGLGFTSNIDPKGWQRQPVNLVAVVDKSGSMDGTPLNLVRQSLEKIVKLLNEKDQLSIVLYGDQSHMYLAPTRVTPSNKSNSLLKKTILARRFCVSRC